MSMQDYNYATSIAQSFIDKHTSPSGVTFASSSRVQKLMKEIDTIGGRLFFPSATTTINSKNLSALAGTNSATIIKTNRTPSLSAPFLASGEATAQVAACIQQIQNRKSTPSSKKEANLTASTDKKSSSNKSSSLFLKKIIYNISDFFSKKSQTVSNEHPSSLLSSTEKMQEATQEAEKYLETVPDLKKQVESFIGYATAKSENAPSASASEQEIRHTVLACFQNVLKNKPIGTQPQSSQSLNKELLQTFAFFIKDSSHISPLVKNTLLRDIFSVELDQISKSAVFTEVFKKLAKHIATTTLFKDATTSESIQDAYKLTLAIGFNEQSEASYHSGARDITKQIPLRGLLSQDIEKNIFNSILEKAEQERDFDTVLDLYSAQSTRNDGTIKKEEPSVHNTSENKKLNLFQKINYQIGLQSIQKIKTAFDEIPKLKEICKNIASILNSDIKDSSIAQNSSEPDRTKYKLELYKAVDACYAAQTKLGVSDSDTIEKSIYEAIFNKIEQTAASPQSKVQALQVFIKDLFNKDFSPLLNSNTILHQIDRLIDSSLPQHRKDELKAIYTEKFTLNFVRFLLSMEKFSQLSLTGITRHIDEAVSKCVTDALPSDVSDTIKQNFFKEEAEKIMANKSPEIRQNALATFSQVMESSVNSQALVSDSERHIIRSELEYSKNRFILLNRMGFEQSDTTIRNELYKKVRSAPLHPAAQELLAKIEKQQTEQECMAQLQSAEQAILQLPAHQGRPITYTVVAQFETAIKNLTAAKNRIKEYEAMLAGSKENSKIPQQLEGIVQKYHEYACSFLAKIKDSEFGEDKTKLSTFFTNYFINSERLVQIFSPTQAKEQRQRYNQSS